VSAGRRIRVIPTLLLRGKGLVKTRRFRDPVYVGDPMNAIRIFNDKEVDELILLDITATVGGRDPDYDLIRMVAGECFMPFCYGGGVSSLAQIERVLKIGVEKVAMNTALHSVPDAVKEATRSLGSSTIVGAIDFRATLLRGATAWVRAGSLDTKVPVVDAARRAEDLGVGELLLNSIQRDGTLDGYDLDVLKLVTEAVRIPVVASGGAGLLRHFRAAVHEGGASAVAAGAMFVLVGRHRAVLITYPTQEQLAEEVFS
jgi:cyclase